MTRLVARAALITAIVVGVTACGGDADEPIVRPENRRITVSGTGSGRVTSAPNGIDCRLTSGATSGTCEFSFANATSVTLTATPDGDQLLRAWGGGCSGTACQLSLTQDVSVSVAFVRRVETRTLEFRTPANDDGAAVISITGAAITGVTGTSGIQVTHRTRTSDGKTFVLVRGQLGTGAVATVSISGLDADKTLTPTVEQVSARQSGNYVQRTNLGAYGATIR